LDYTLRDWFYYNNWKFLEKLINKYLAAIYKAGINIVELGFRNFDEKKFNGGCACTRCGFIKILKDKNKNFIPYHSITIKKLNIPSSSLHTLLD